MSHVHSIDPAALDMLAHADGCGIETAFTRADKMKPCPIGASGACCRICSMGPCRLVGKDAENMTGVCGADMGTIAARHFARQVAGGAAAHSDHGRDMAMALLAVASGEAAGYRIKDEQKLFAVASYMGIVTAGRQVAEIAAEVATTALAQFGQPTGEIIYTRRATQKRQSLWKRLGLTPRAVDREITEVLHRTHEGVDLDPENILKSALRCSLADGWGGAMLSTDISDILFGTPSPLASEVNLGVLKADQVNVVVHGHEPTLSAMLVEAVRDPELIAEAKAQGADGINLAGICCTANEILMRYGIPPAGNFLHQELAVLTGAVEAMVVDVQCIMQALGPLSQRFHTKLVTTSPKAKIPGALHVEFDEHRAPETAREIIRLAIANYPNRGPIHIPDYHEPLVAGFSHEYLNYMQGGFHRGSFRPLNDAIIAGRVRGLAGVVGCNNARVTQDEAIVELIRNFIAKDVMVVVTGCAATAGAKAGFLSPEILDAAGPGLREVMEAIGIPPVLHLGSCVDNSRILTVLTQVATEGGLGEDIDDLPAVGLCPEWMCEKAIAIGTYFAASGAHVIFGVNSPVEASSEVTRLMTSGWEELVGGSLEFIPDWNEMLARSLELIDAKRAALKLKPYDPSQFGASGDSLYFEAIRAYLAEQACEAQVETVGSTAFPLAAGHTHDHGDGHPHHDGHGGGGLMSRYIATRALRGADRIVAEAEAAVADAIERLGPDAPVAFTNTAYYLPVIYAFTGRKIEKLGDLPPTLERARQLLHPTPNEKMWLPYLGETLDAGMATLFAEEVIEGVRFAQGLEPQILHLGRAPSDTERFTGGDLLVHGDKMKLNGPIDDIQLRAWGIQLVDGRMPGFAAIVGCAKSNEVAVKIVRELQSRGILIFLSGNVNGRSIIHQLQEEGIQLGYDTFTVPFGIDTISAVYALGFAARSALTFGGMDAGQARKIMLYNKARVFAFVLALGEVDDLKYATAAGAISYGFPVIADTRIPQILPTGVTTYEHVVSMPFDEIPGEDDLERAEKLIQRCMDVRGVKVKMAKVPIPVAFGSAFEGERVRKEIMYAEFGGKRSHAFEYLRMKVLEEVEDGKVTVVGPDIDSVERGASLSLGILVDVAGRKMQKDFESIIERQFHYFVNMAEGIQHNGQRDITWIRLSDGAYAKGFRLEHIGKLLHARIHDVFGNIVDKVSVKLITDESLLDPVLDEARTAYRERNERMANLTDESVDTFYSCLLCQSFAPTHVCVVNPERVGLCGAYNWLDCKASFEINPTGPNQPVPKGVCIDPVTGEFSGPNEFVFAHSNQTVERVTFYSIMEAPLTSCGCFECIMVLVPEANGFMIVSREDPSMTPCGMTFSTLAGTAGGGLQTPGMMGMGKYYLTSKKFIPADGGMRRVVWMSSLLKVQMAAALEEVCVREGMPDLMDRIADETCATTVEELLPFLEEKGHPALTMDPLF